MKWDRSLVFDRVSNIYSFSQDPLLRKKVRKHIYLPWDASVAPDLMFRIKRVLSEEGRCYIPFVEKDYSQSFMSDELFEALRKQVESGAETHLIMSNLDSVHILRLDGIERRDSASPTVVEFEQRARSCVWLQVGDLFVFRANHTGPSSSRAANEAALALEELTTSAQTQNLFASARSIELSSELERVVHFQRWLEMDRSLTYDYFIRSRELQENIYQDSWTSLSGRTQHFLIMAEQARHKGIMLRGEEKTRFLKESFEFYLSAVIGELNEVYIRPLIKAFSDYHCLREAWEETRQGLVHPRIESIISDLLESKSDQLHSVEIFLEYLQAAKSFLFSLKNRFAKKIGKEEYLLIESFLARQETLVESFTCKDLDDKLESVLRVKDWLKSVIENLGDFSAQELEDANLKLTHLLNIMSSPSIEDNIFFRLVEEKTSRSVAKRSFDDEVKALIKLAPLKSIA